jgi:anti-sigma B factor antagonist
MKTLQIEETTKSDRIQLSLTGDLDAMTADTLLSALDKIKKGACKFVVIDFSRVQLVDSSGIGAMVSILKYTRSEGGDTVIVGLNGQPKEVFCILNLDKAIKVYPDIDDVQ